MRYFVFSEIFFKEIAGKGNLYSRLWFYWLGEFPDEIFKPTFLEIQILNLNRHISETEITEIYNFGLQFLKDFKISERKENKSNTPEQTKVAEKVIEYMNSVSGTSFKTTESNLKIIIGRQQEGFTISDFKIVIDKKYQEWRATDMMKFFRPMTLFNKSKFENYLNSINEQHTQSKFSQFADSVDRAKQLIKIRKK
jgi:uncharacterized phage protein (TIGR02220 family)